MSNFKHARKYHFIYKTTNLINGKYYIGMHSTNELNDGYIGSGKHLWYSIRKYGIENFKCEILEFLSDRTLLANRERELVNEEVLKDPNCMNLKHGGRGGFSIDDAKRGGHVAGKIHANKLKNDKIYLQKFTNRNSIRMKRLHEENLIPPPPTFAGKHHSAESKEKMRLSSKGKGVGKENSQFGTCWITNGIENKKIKRNELNNFINDGWKLGRRI